MKRFWLTMFVLVSMLVMSAAAFGATITLTATWDANTETDLAGYRVYRTDGTRAMIGTVLPPAHQYGPFTLRSFPISSAGILKFVVTAYDTNNNESADSNTATWTYNLDTIPPGAPKSLKLAMLREMFKPIRDELGVIRFQVHSVELASGEKFILDEEG